MSIASWSSIGGNTQNKDNASDIMYLVTQGDIIIFSITTSGSTSYKWYVNKVNQNINLNTISFNVPYKKDIWEIHVEESDSVSTNHVEWVISTIPINEAPVLFESFSDKKYNGRTVNDPWGRPSIEWSLNLGTPNTNECSFLNGALTKSFYDNILNKPYLYGTWVFWWRQKDGNATSGDFQVYFSFASVNSNNNRYFVYHEPNDHWRFVHRSEWMKEYYGINSPDSDNEAEMSQEGPAQGPTDIWMWDNNWHKITTIHTEEGWWYQFMDDELIAHTPHFDNGPLKGIYNMFRMYTSGQWELDNFTFFDKSYLFPEIKIQYVNTFIDNWIANGKDPANYFITDPIYRNDGAILVEGRDITLEKINQTINNPSIFTYDSINKIATCNTNLVIEKGAKFVMNGETLKINCNSPGEKEIKMKIGAFIQIDDSIITTTNNNHFVWNISGTGTIEVQLEYHQYETFHTNNHRRGTIWSSDGRFIVRNSTIDNFSNLSLDGVGSLILENSYFTNIVEDLYGNYTPIGRGAYDKYKTWLNFKKGVLIFNCLPLIDYKIKNVTFSGKSTNPPINITFVGGMWITDENKIQDVLFINANLKVMKGYKYDYYVDWQSIQPWLNCNVSLVNCNNTSLITSTDRSTISLKYYVEVKAIDNFGNPIPNADITIYNNIDNINNPSENLNEELRWRFTKNTFYENLKDSSGYGERGWFMGHPKVNIKQNFVTNMQGITSLPDDNINTIILTDSSINNSVTTKHNYKITASYNGKTSTYDNLVLDSTWLRDNAFSIKKRVMLNIDTGMGYIEDIQCPQPICDITITQ